MSEIADLAREKFGEPNRRLSTRSELRFGRHGSVAVCLHGDRAGLWFDHERQEGGRLDDNTHHRAQSDRPSSGPLSWDSPSAERFQAIVGGELCRVDDAFTRAPALRPIERSPAHEYLFRRGITRWPEHSIKGWHRAGIAYLARTVSGQILALQVLPLTPDGRKDAAYWSDGVTKRTYAACGGWSHYAAVRLPGRGEVILCEGVETGLSIWLATGRPVAACLGTAGLRNLRCGRKLTIARDGDVPGSPADDAFARTLETRRRLKQRVRVAMPPIGKDFNDIHQLHGLGAVRALIGSAREQ